MVGGLEGNAVVDRLRAKQRDEAKLKIEDEVEIIRTHCDDLIELHKKAMEKHHQIQQLLLVSGEEFCQWRNELNMITKEQQVHGEHQEGNTVA